MSKRIKSFKTRKVNFFKNVLDTRISNKEKILFEGFLDSYISHGEKLFTYEAILDIGKDPEEVSESYLSIYNEIAINLRSKVVVEFVKSNLAYKSFISGFIGILYHQILNLKEDKLAPGILCTDLSLMFMLAVTYFPEEADLLGKQLLNSLEDLKQTMETNIRPMRGEYGLTSVVPLASFLATIYKKDALSKKIEPYCRETNSSYRKAMNGLFSKDEDIVNEWVDEMVEFHLKNSKLDLTLPFNHEEWQYFPIEIIALLELRLQKGLKIDFIESKFLAEFLPHLGVSLPIPLDSITERLKEKIN